MSHSELARIHTADHWSSENTWVTGYGLHWTELSAVQQRLNAKVSNSPDATWVTYTLQKYFADRLPVARCLVLGCGTGGLERKLAEHSAFVTCDAFDIAEEAIHRAHAKASEMGYRHISYCLCDLHDLSLPREHYDVIWACSVLHHLDRLEYVFAQISQALKPGGLFIFNEYVGPDRFQFPTRQREAIHACHQLIPAAYRHLRRPASDQPGQSHRPTIGWYAQRFVGKMRDGDLVGFARRRLRRLVAQWQGTNPVKTEPNLPTLSSVIAVDPSEAIRSSEILAVVPRYFEMIENKPLGGSLLQFLLAGIAGNFQDEIGTHLLDMFFSIEDALMTSGDLGSDFAYVVARPRVKQEIAQ